MSKKKIRRPQQYKRSQERTMKEWWQDLNDMTRKRILWSCIAVVAVIALLLIYYFGIYDDGSLKVKDNALVGAQENWLVGQRDSGKNSKYYHFADVTAPEGYTATESAMSVQLQQAFSYEKDGITLGITPVGSSLKTLVESVYPTLASLVGEDGSISEIQDYSSKLGDAKYFTYSTNVEQEDGERQFTKSLAMYTPCSYKDSCILVSASAHEDVADDVLLTEALKALDGVTLPAKK